jgi:hypothetical protein
MRAALAFLNGAGSRRRRQSGGTDRGLLLLTDLLVNPGVTALNPGVTVLNPGVTVLDPSGTGKRAAVPANAVPADMDARAAGRAPTRRPQRFSRQT